MAWEGGRMCTHLPFFVALLAFAAPASAATRNFGVTGFDRIRVDGPYRVHLTTGIAPFAKASGSMAALDRVAIEVQGRTLIVHANQSWGGYPGQDIGPVEITVGTHELSSAWLNGAGSLQVDKVKALAFDISVNGSGVLAIDSADVDQLSVFIAGTASAKLAGQAGKMTATLRGNSSLDAGRLVTKDAAIGAQGPATVNANVTNSAEIAATGVATISLTGSPACTNKLTGSASVSGCKPSAWDGSNY
jgi:putative autotransporter adhesin-like protein